MADGCTRAEAIKKFESATGAAVVDTQGLPPVLEQFGHAIPKERAADTSEHLAVPDWMLDPLNRQVDSHFYPLHQAIFSKRSRSFACTAQSATSRADLARDEEFQDAFGGASHVHTFSFEDVEHALTHKNDVAPSTTLFGHVAKKMADIPPEAELRAMYDDQPDAFANVYKDATGKDKTLDICELRDKYPHIRGLFPQQFDLEAFKALEFDQQRSIFRDVTGEAYTAVPTLPKNFRNAMLKRQAESRFAIFARKQKRNDEQLVAEIDNCNAKEDQISELVALSASRPAFAAHAHLQTLFTKGVETGSLYPRQQWDMHMRMDKTPNTGGSRFNMAMHVRLGPNAQAKLADHGCRVVYMRCAVANHAISAIISKDERIVTLIDSNRGNNQAHFNEMQTLVYYTLATLLPGGFAFESPRHPMCQNKLKGLLGGSCYMWAQIQNELTAQYGTADGIDVLHCMKTQLNDHVRVDPLRAYYSMLLNEVLERALAATYDTRTGVLAMAPPNQGTEDEAPPLATFAIRYNEAMPDFYKKNVNDSMRYENVNPQNVSRFARRRYRQAKHIEDAEGYEKGRGHRLQTMLYIKGIAGDVKVIHSLKRRNPGPEFDWHAVAYVPSSALLTTLAEKWPVITPDNFREEWNRATGPGRSQQSAIIAAVMIETVLAAIQFLPDVFDYHQTGILGQTCGDACTGDDILEFIALPARIEFKADAALAFASWDAVAGAFNDNTEPDMLSSERFKKNFLSTMPTDRKPSMFDDGTSDVPYLSRDSSGPAGHN